MKRYVRVYAHLLTPTEPNMGEMFRSVHICTSIVELITKYFGGKAIYVGDGSECVQYDDVIEFEEISDRDFKTILNMFPCAVEYDPALRF